MHTFQSIKKLNQAVQVSLLGEASAYNFSVLKRPKYGSSAMPKGHSLIKYRNQYFLFTSEPPSEGQGATNPNWTKAAIWQCDRNGKRTAPLEDPLWDSKKDGWSAEDAFDSFLDYTGGDLSEAAKETTMEYKTFREFIAETNSRIYEAAAPKKGKKGKKAKTPKAKKKPIVEPIVDWSAYDKWKKRLSPAAAAKENKRIADVHKLFKLSRSEKEHWKGIGHEGGRGGFDGGHGPSPGSRWI